MFLDGIRYSVQILDLAYRRLQSGLLTLSTQRRPQSDALTSVFLDAWSSLMQVIVCGFSPIECQTQKERCPSSTAAATTKRASSSEQFLTVLLRAARP
jgi:hypothetical protein